MIPAFTDTQRLNWLLGREAYVAWSKDNEVCHVRYVYDREDQSSDEQPPAEGYPLKCYYDAREAIDAAMRYIA